MYNRTTPILALAALLLVPAATAQQTPGTGALEILDSDGTVRGTCPLKQTDVTADISGFLTRTTVRQVFYNPSDQKIEAIYVFPLAENSAVDRMIMTIGERRIIGEIKERGEARAIYEAARAAGHVASLLDQERRNIFTQSVANIEPGVEITIEISYVETLAYEAGEFTWIFPMVVGPRYVPGGGSAPAPMTSGRPTDQVPDADRITPPVTPPNVRAGHDISITVRIAGGGLAVRDVQSTLHEVTVAAPMSERCGSGATLVTLTKQREIPNKDFTLRYRLGDGQMGNAFLVHEDQRGAFFTMILQPPERVVPKDVLPRELIFVLDTSGSMRGFPIEKAKETMARLIDTMRPEDTFNLITFAGQTRILWDAPRTNTPDHRAAAQEFLLQQRGGGGTEMMKAIDAALMPGSRRAENAVRVVCFMTDGYVGNDLAIVEAIKRNAGTTRVFSFGIGNSVNRFLLSGMAHAGRGEAEFVTLESQAAGAVERFHERILAPVLTDIAIDWGTLPVADVYPTRIPDLFAAKPVVIHGRLTGPATGNITLKGTTGAGAYEQALALQAPTSPPDRDALAALWARAKVDDLTNRDLAAIQRGNFPEEFKRQVIGLGLEFGLLTQFTSFVAVEELEVTSGGELVTVRVPVEMPDGVSHEGVFGLKRKASAGFAARAKSAPATVAGGRFAGGRPAPTAARGRGDVRLRRGVAEVAEDREEAQVEREPVEKLAAPLRDLAARVAKDGVDGNLTVGTMRVVDYRVDVQITLRKLDDEVRAALAKLGFTTLEESGLARLLIGSIDVRKLAELVELESVVSVRPLQ